MRKYARTTSILLSTALSTFLLGACGGGGTSSKPSSIPAPPPVQSQPPSPPPPAPPAPPAQPASQIPPATIFDTDEYRRSNAVSAHGALKVYEGGASGKGVKVAVLDSGINAALPAFRGRIDPNSQDVVWDGEFDRGVTDSIGHGTAVASILAGARDEQITMGVAFESTILSLNTATCDAWRQCKHAHGDLRKALDIARESGARIVNMSLGGDTIAPELLEAIGRATKAGMVIVVSAGNDGDISPNNFALEAARGAGNGNVIIAGAITSDRQLADFSNAGGAGAEHFLAALGAGVSGQDQNGNAANFNGTSYSAPVVSGAAALLAGAFPHLTGAQIVEILLGSADDAGAPGTDYLFGRGILNIERAFAPQGGLKMAGTGIAVTASAPPSGSPAMGDGGGAIPMSAVVLDGYERAYRMDLPTGLAQAPVSRPLAPLAQAGQYRSAFSAAGPLFVSITSFRSDSPQDPIAATALRMGERDSGRARLVAGIAMSRLSQKTKVALGISEDAATLQKRLSDAADHAFLVAQDTRAQTGFQAVPGTSVGFRHALGRGGFTLTHEMGEVAEPWTLRGDENGYRMSSLTYDRRIGAHKVALGLSRMEEDRTLLGGAFSSTFYSGRASSYFLDAGADLQLGSGWTSSLAWRAGLTRVPTNGAMVDAGKLWTNAFAFDLAREGAFGARDRIALRVSQPLRVARGGFDMTVPVSYDHETRTAGFGRHFFNLAPKGREIDYEVSYAAPLFTGSVSANAFVRTQPGHVAARANDLGAAFRFSSAF